MTEVTGKWVGEGGPGSGRATIFYCSNCPQKWGDIDIWGPVTQHRDFRKCPACGSRNFKVRTFTLPKDWLEPPEGRTGGSF